MTPSVTPESGLRTPCETVAIHPDSAGESTDSGRGFAEYEDRPVPPAARKSLFSVSAVWLGFPMILTCAVFGGMVVYSLGFWRGMAAILAGNLILMVYVGSLSFHAGRTGENFALTAARTFGSRGYRIPAAFLTSVVIGWFAFQTGLTGSTLASGMGWNATLVAGLAGIGYLCATLLGIRALAVIGMIAAPLFIGLGVVAIVFASSTAGSSDFTSYGGQNGLGVMGFGAAVTLVVALFADSGTMTGDFTRWSANGRRGFWASFAAFPVGNTIALTVGGVIVAMGAAADPARSGGDFLRILIDHGGVLVPLAVAFVFINLGSVCTHCLYNGAVGWSQLTGLRMRTLTVVLGFIGVALAVLGVWSYFQEWLDLLGVIVPPLGAVLIADQVRNLDQSRAGVTKRWHPDAFIAWALGSAAALSAHYLVPASCVAVVGIVVAAAVTVGLRRLGRVPTSPPDGIASQPDGRPAAILTTPNAGTEEHR